MKLETTITYYLIAATVLLAIVHNVLLGAFKVKDVVFLMLGSLAFLAFLLYLVYVIIIYFKEKEPADVWKLGYIGILGLFGFFVNQNLFVFLFMFLFFAAKDKKEMNIRTMFK